MFKHFRTRRKRPINSRKYREYVLYALGEIMLVVIGILLALQVNNWNERRKQAQRFRVALEQLYTSIKQDSEIIYHLQFAQQKQIQWIDQILADAGQFDPKSLLHILFYLDTKPRMVSSETDFLLQSLEFNPNRVEQNELAKQISSYVKNDAWDFHRELWGERIYITPLLEEAGIPGYPSTFGYSALWNFETVDTAFFSEQDILTLHTLLKTRKFRNALKSLRKIKEEANVTSFQNYLTDSHSILNAIREFDPEVRLRFDDVGILGTAFESGFEKSIPMTLSDPQQGIWEIDAFLRTGKVKFRTRDSWNQNWGGVGFPEGRTLMFGSDILVEEGYYHIVLDLTRNMYAFHKTEKP